MKMQQPYAGGSSSVSSGGRGNVYSGRGSIRSGSISPDRRLQSGGGFRSREVTSLEAAAPSVSPARGEIWPELSQEQLRLARNKIYMHVSLEEFKTKEIQDYFNSKS